jgi:glycosyltransferase involved in cell wall biosynthesis
MCIATMNRGDVIGETLESILSQAGDDVEVVVLDGASTDDTQQVVERFRQKYPALRYIRQASNGGVDKDYDLTVQAATGEYCWLMSDDDLVTPDALKTVLAAIDRGYPLIVVNAEVRSRDMSELVEVRRLEFDADREYAPGQLDAFFRDAGEYLSFIGCVVIRRSLWMERRREPYFGTLFIHMGVIFQAPVPGTVLVIARPLILVRWGNALWKPKEFEIWMFKWPDLIWSFECLSPQAREAVCIREPWKRLRTLLYYRAKGTYSAHEYRKWLRPKVASSRERLGARAVALVPGFVANLIALLYTFRPGQRSKMARLDVMKSRYYFGNWFNAKR